MAIYSRLLLLLILLGARLDKEKVKNVELRASEDCSFQVHHLKSYHSAKTSVLFTIK